MHIINCIHNNCPGGFVLRQLIGDGLYQLVNHLYPFPMVLMLAIAYLLASSSSCLSVVHMCECRFVSKWQGPFLVSSSLDSRRVCWSVPKVDVYQSLEFLWSTSLHWHKSKYWMCFSDPWSRYVSSSYIVLWLEPLGYYSILFTFVKVKGTIPVKVGQICGPCDCLLHCGWLSLSSQVF